MSMYDKRHGGAYDRGRADSYYQRGFTPHLYKGGTGSSERVELGSMSVEDIIAYTVGYNENEAEQNFKEYY